MPQRAWPRCAAVGPMKPYRRLAEATAPDGTVLSLFEHDGACLIRVNGIELMSTRRHRSEDALAELACGPLRERAGMAVLIGGLGLGFTLKAALRTLAPDARVVVAEIVAEVIDWNRNPAYPLAGETLRDPRVELRHEDVAVTLAEHRRTFDAIMLDIDNGADALVTSSNAGLYRLAGIQAATGALRPGGRLCYWSAADDPAFVGSLRQSGLEVTRKRIRAHATSGPWHTVYLAESTMGDARPVAARRSPPGGVERAP
ncbi:MAG: spermidine synthase [Gemmatimonadetes bacterium]|nr:spermidine synthase [Gemmatimonadota bacterium]